MVVTGVITFFLIEILGYNGLFYLFGGLGVIGLGLLFTWEDEDKYLDNSIDRIWKTYFLGF